MAQGVEKTCKEIIICPKPEIRDFGSQKSMIFVEPTDKKTGF